MYVLGFLECTAVSKSLFPCMFCLFQGVIGEITLFRTYIFLDVIEKLWMAMFWGMYAKTIFVTR